MFISVVIYFSIQISIEVNIYKRIKILRRTRSWKNFKRIVFFSVRGLNFRKVWQERQKMLIMQGRRKRQRKCIFLL